ncbi:PHP domain-containing protein [Natrialbaceae archaeon A-arb3/5]
MQDFHVHSTYSDGGFLERMVRAAENADLDGIGFADHCIVGDREEFERLRERYGFSFDLTYERRRRAIQRLREETPVTIYDAVEIDYAPECEAAIEDFCRDAAFDYTIGSVHEIDGLSVQEPSDLAPLTEDKREAFVDRYVENLVSLVESELFDVAAHVDLITRTPALRGRITDDHHRQVARALADSRTVPEINAGRVLRDGGAVHPSETFLEILSEHDVSVTVGTDSHRPDEIGPRAAFLTEFVEARGLEPVVPPALDR